MFHNTNQAVIGLNENFNYKFRKNYLENVSGFELLFTYGSKINELLLA